MTEQIAKHFRDLHFGGNWTGANLRDLLQDVDWKLATTPVHDLNTIAALVFHINYYVSAMLKVLDGQPLEAHDKFSYELPPLASEEDWQQLVNKAFIEATLFSEKVEQLDDAKLSEYFADPKYGNYFRNLLGVTEHTHYHLGQISLIKKILLQERKK